MSRQPPARDRQLRAKAMTTFNFNSFPEGFADKVRQHLKASMRACIGAATPCKASEPVGGYATSTAPVIDSGFPEAGGGASANRTTGNQPTLAASDDDGGDADPEPAKRRTRQQRPATATHQATPAPQGDALLKIQVVLQRTSLSKSTLYAKIKEGSFPQPVRLGARCSRWKASELDQWLSRIGQ